MIHSFLKSLFLLYFYANYSHNIFNYLKVEGFWYSDCFQERHSEQMEKTNKQKQPNPLRQEGGKIQNETCWFSHNTYCCPGPWLCWWAPRLYREWNFKSKVGAGIWFSWALVSHTMTQWAILFMSKCSMHFKGLIIQKQCGKNSESFRIRC